MFRQRPNKKVHRDERKTLFAEDKEYISKLEKNKKTLSNKEKELRNIASLLSAEKNNKNIIMAGDAVASFSMATITGAMLMGMLAGDAVLKKIEGAADAFGEYDKKWRKELKQASMDNMQYFFL